MYLTVCRAPLLVELFVLASNTSSCPAYCIHYTNTALEQGTSSCSVQRDVENNQNYHKINVLKHHIGVRDKGNESLLITCVVTWFSPADYSPLTLQGEMSPHVLVIFVSFLDTSSSVWYFYFLGKVD